LAGVMEVWRFIMALPLYYVSKRAVCNVLLSRSEVRVRGGGVAGQSINQWMLD
jgi:hypothetical protein